MKCIYIASYILELEVKWYIIVYHRLPCYINDKHAHQHNILKLHTTAIMQGQKDQNINNMNEQIIL